jgi:mono/diheme cytochrome c family protein
MNRLSECGAVLVFLGALLLPLVLAHAQLIDNNLAPNEENAGINKTLEEQIGDGRGDPDTPNTSLFIIQRDPFRAIRRGRQIFQRKFSVFQGLGPRVEDGVGNIEQNTAIGNGLMDSCAGCHASPRGGFGVGGAILQVRPDHRDTPHGFGVGIKEMLADEITADLRAIRARVIELAQQRGRDVKRSLTSKGISYGEIIGHPDGTTTLQLDGDCGEGNPQAVNSDLRVRPLFAEGREFSLRELARNAFRNAMGLIAEDPDLEEAFNGGRVVTPSGLVLDGRPDPQSPTGQVDTFTPPITPRPEFGETDFEIPMPLLDFMEFYLLHYFKPGRYQETATTDQGRRIFEEIGCTTCHMPDHQLKRDRRVADLETVYDPERGIFNNLFTTVTAMLRTVNDIPSLPPKKVPLGQPFLVKNIFTDFKRHNLGPNFWERNFDGTIQQCFMTPPLWGVGTTDPYGHDGRSINLREVILRHGGEAEAQRNAFAHLSERRQEAVIRFLQSLILWPPEDTATNLDPGDRSNPLFPQRGHGSVRLTVLFNDPNDPE